MKQTVRLLLGDRKWTASYRVMVAVFVAILAFTLVSSIQVGWGMFLTWLLFACPFFGLATLLYWQTGEQNRRLDGLEVVCGPEGIGIAHHGQNQWILSWDRYGGFRAIRVGFWKSIVRPEASGSVEIYDREGILRGVLPSAANGSGSPVSRATIWAAIREELERRIPEGGIASEPPRVPFQGISPGKAKRLLVTGIAIAFPMAFVFSKVQDVWWDGTDAPGWIAWMAQGYGALLPMLGMILGISIAFWGFLAITTRLSMEARNKIAPPEQGPTVLQLQVEQVTHGKVVLKEGSRYRYVHPEELEHKAKGELNGVRAVCAIGIPLLIGATVVMFLDPSTPKIAPLFPIALFTLVVWFLIDYFRKYVTFLGSLKDTLIYSHGMLVVVRPDGSHLSFPGVSGSYRNDLSSIRIRSLRNGKDRYAFLPTHLYEVGPADELDAELALPLVEQP